MNILVTGHNGYIGSVMVPVLQAAGHSVAGLDTCFFEKCGFVSDDYLVTCIRKDIRDVSIDDVQGFDAIVHLAALSNDPLSDLDPALTFDINHKASVHLATLAKKAGVQRFLFASTCSVYGKADPEEILTENSPPSPLGAYAISKIRAEMDIAELADTHFSPTFLRNATTYGVSPRLRADLALNSLVGWACTTGKIRILKDTTAWRPMVHVQDVAHAFAAVLAAPKGTVNNQVFNVGSGGENYRVCDLIEIVRKTIPRCEVEYANENVSDIRSYRVAFGKLASSLPSLQLTWNILGGIEELHDAFQQVGLDQNELLGRKYIRLLYMNYLIKSGYLDGNLHWQSSAHLNGMGNDDAQHFP